jgi:hypothetical protein
MGLKKIFGIKVYINITQKMNAEEAKKLALQNNMIVALVLSVLQSQVEALAKGGRFSMRLKSFIFADKENKESVPGSSAGENIARYEGIILEIMPSLNEDPLKDLGDEMLNGHYLYGETPAQWLKILEPLITDHFKAKGFRIEGTGIDMVISWY